MQKTNSERSEASLPHPLSPSRRGILAILSGAAAGALTMPAGALAASPQSGADAELLALCADYQLLHAAWNVPDISAEEEDKLGRARQAALKRMAAIPHTTPEGLAAKAAVAHSAMMFNVRTCLDKNWRDEATPEEMAALDVLQAVAAP